MTDPEFVLLGVYVGGAAGALRWLRLALPAAPRLERLLLAAIWPALLALSIPELVRAFRRRR